MSEIFQTPLFGILLSLLAFETGVWLNQKTKSAICNPLLVALILVIGFLMITDIKLEIYNLGGDYISFFLAPATAVLAVPLYKQIERLKSNWFSVLTGIIFGSFISVLLVIGSAKLFGLSNELCISLIPKSITTPMGIEVSKILGGMPGITVASIVITGITGAVITPVLCKIFRIKDPIAIGVAVGTTSHAVGTARAMEMGEIQGAMSSLSIGIAGLTTSLTAPFFIHFFLQ